MVEQMVNSMELIFEISEISMTKGAVPMEQYNLTEYIFMKVLSPGIYAWT